jgi:hypothetical protein
LLLWLEEFAHVERHTADDEVHGFLRGVSDAAEAEFVLFEDSMLDEVFAPGLEAFPEA